MAVVLSFALTLLLALLVSELAGRSILSTAVVFLVAGFVVGPGLLSVLSFSPQETVVIRVVEVALFAVLFSDGMRVGVRDMVSAWRLPGRALLLGLPLTLLGTASLARLVTGLPWIESLLLGAVLSPTDPVLVAALVGREEVPIRLRRLLNVESGLNDGLVLPVVLILLSIAGRSDAHILEVFAELGLGIVVGIVIPTIFLLLERTRFFAVGSSYAGIDTFAIGLAVFGLASVTDANLFLAAFSAGITVASMVPEPNRFVEPLAELLKLLALFVFGSLISPSFLAEIPAAGYVFAALALLLVRPVALEIALVASPLDRWERAVAGWFGPKGFASVVFALLVLQARIGESDRLFHLAALVIAGSIVAHSSTDVLVARRFREEESQAR
jgi:sodium/hydrogen antiporter